MRIQRSANSNPFCVPAALAALTGWTVDQSVAKIQKKLGNVPISDVFYPEILRILKEHGYTFKETKLQSKDRYSGKYLLCFHGHVGVIDNFTYYDNGSPEGTLTLPRAKVKVIYEIFEPGGTAQ